MVSSGFLLARDVTILGAASKLLCHEFLRRDGGRQNLSKNILRGGAQLLHSASAFKS
jgi:hypothetical protein